MTTTDGAHKILKLVDENKHVLALPCITTQKIVFPTCWRYYQIADCELIENELLRLIRIYKSIIDVHGGTAEEYTSDKITDHFRELLTQANKI
jgi:hypothetical protein